MGNTHTWSQSHIIHARWHLSAFSKIQTGKHWHRKAHTHRPEISTPLSPQSTPTHSFRSIESAARSASSKWEHAHQHTHTQHTLISDWNVICRAVCLCEWTCLCAQYRCGWLVNRARKHMPVSKYIWLCICVRVCVRVMWMDEWVACVCEHEVRV